MKEEKIQQARLGGRLYLFPAIVPVASLLPFFLSMVGVLAGTVHFFLKKKAHLLVLALVVCASCFIVDSYRGGAGRRYILSLLQGTPLRVTTLPELVIHKNFSMPPVKELKNKLVSHKAFTEEWFKLVPNPSLSKILFSHGLLFIGTADHKVVAYSFADGEKIWSITKTAPVLALTQSEHYLLVGEGLHSDNKAAVTLIALPQGPVIWQKEIPGHQEVEGLIDEANDRVYFSGGPSGIWCVTLTRGELIWQKPVGHTDSKPMIYGNQLVVLAQNDLAQSFSSKLMFLNLKTGDVEFEIPLPGQPWGNPILLTSIKQSNRILLTTAIGQIKSEKSNADAGWVHLVSPTEKKILWSKKFENFIIPESLVISNLTTDLSIHAFKSGNVIALNLIDGSTAWEFKTPGDILSPLALGNLEQDYSVIAAQSTDGTLIGLNSSNGKVIFKIEVEKNSTSKPIFVNNRLFVTSPTSLSSFILYDSKK